MKNLFWAASTFMVLAGCISPTVENSEDLVSTSDALTNGMIYTLKLSKMSGDTGNCVDVNGASTDNGGNIQEWNCNGTGAQSFKAVDMGGGYFQLVNTHSGKCIQVDCPEQNGSCMVNGRNISQWS